FRYARDMGYAIRLLAYARDHGDDVELRVHPALLPQSHLLAAVHDTYNAVVIEGDLVGSVLLYGQGAGGRPTASAVVGDVIDLVFSIRKGIDNRIAVDFSRNRRLRSMDEVETAAYFRLHVADRAGVLAEVTRVLGELG